MSKKNAKKENDIVNKTARFFKYAGTQSGRWVGPLFVQEFNNGVMVTTNETHKKNIMNYKQLKRLELAVYEAAEKLASETDVDGLVNYSMEVETEDIRLPFMVDAIVTDLEEEEETNSRSYHVSIFCHGTAVINDDYDFQVWLHEKFHNEVLYKD